MTGERSTGEFLEQYYDILVDWDRRLAHESPFFQRAFQSVHAKSVLDCACGTGHHACLFARWGMEVAGSDVSAEMVRRSEHLAATQSLSIEFQQASFDALSSTFSEPFDTAVCVGNSLAAAGKRRIVAEGIRQMHELLRPGGAVIIQVINFERFPPGENVYGDPVHREHVGQNYIFLKTFRRAGTTCDLDILMLTSGATDTWTRTVFRERLLVLDSASLVGMLEQAGFGKIKLYGGYEMTAFDPRVSRDLIAVARRE